MLAVPSEEDGGAGMLAAIRAGFVADAAVITEPTRLEIVTVQAGAITFRLAVPGRAAHASVRREGVSALEKLEVLHAALRADEAARNAAETRPEMRALGLPYPTIIGTVHGGDWASTVPDLLVAEGRYGVRAGQTAEEAAGELRTVVAAACAADPWLRAHPATLTFAGGRFSSAEVPRRPPAAPRPGRGRGEHPRAAPAVRRRSVRGRHAAPGPAGRDADRDVRAGRRPRAQSAWPAPRRRCSAAGRRSSALPYGADMRLLAGRG